MSQIYSNNENRKGKHITERERYFIEILLKERMLPREIAKRLGRHKRTIEREIKRGQITLLNSDYSYRKEYCAYSAQREYIRNAQNKGPILKIGHDHKLAKHIEEKIIKEKYSPDAIIGEIKKRGIKFETNICTKTLYNYIDKEIFANISNKDLPVKCNKKTRKNKKVRIAYKNLKGTSIEDRPKSIEKREDYGHWEMDCVLGKRTKGPVLLVLSERKTRQEIILKIKDKSQLSVIKAVDELEKKYKNKFYKKFKTITVDNGSEFLDFESLEKSALKTNYKRTQIYYAHPYSSWERGTNENINKLIRRFIPKGMDIEKISKSEIKRIEHWINNYPRKMFGYKSANEIAS